MKKRILTFLMAALVLTASGCSSSQESTTEESTSASTSQQEQTEETSQEAVEGSLTVYTSQPEEDIQALVEGFNEIYPDVEVSIFRSGTEEVISKVLAEKQVGAMQADVLLVSDAVTFEGLKDQDILMSYESPELEGISDEYYDDENTYTGTKIITTGIMVNTDVVTDEVTGYDCLISEDAKDNAIMPSPLYSGAAAYNLSVLTKTDGFGWEYYEGLKANGIKVDQGNGKVQQAVMSGEKGYGLIVDYMALRAKADGAPVDFVYPEEGSLLVTEPVGIVNGTKNEQQAKAFVDYILSDEGQEKTAEIGYTPIKSGVAAPEGFKSVDEITNLTYDMKELVESKEADKETFASMFGA